MNSPLALLLLLACNTIVLAQVNFYYYNPVFWNNPQVFWIKLGTWNSDNTISTNVTMIRCSSNEGYYVSPATITPPGGDTNGFFLPIGEDVFSNDLVYDNANGVSGDKYQGLNWIQTNVLLNSPAGTNGTFVNSFTPTFTKSSGCNPTTQFYYNNAQWTANGYNNIQLSIWDHSYVWEQTYTMQTCGGGWWTAAISGDAYRSYILPFDSVSVNLTVYDNDNCVSGENNQGISFFSPYNSLVTTSSQGCSGTINSFFTGVVNGQTLCYANSTAAPAPSTQFFYNNPIWAGNSEITQVQLWTWDKFYNAEAIYNLVTKTEHGVTYYYSPAVHRFLDPLTMGYFLPVAISSSNFYFYDHADCSSANYYGLFNYSNPANGLYSLNGCNGVFNSNFVPPTPTPTPTSTSTPTPTSTSSATGSGETTSTPFAVAAASSSSVGAVVGGIIGGLAALILLILLLWCLRSRYWKRSPKKLGDENLALDSDYSSVPKIKINAKSEPAVSFASVDTRMRSELLSDSQPERASQGSFNDRSRSSTDSSALISSSKSDDIIIPFASLKLGAVLGDGNFGQVFRASYRGAEVAVKKLKDVDKKKEQIMEEAKMMKSIPPHPNVLYYFGVSEHEGEIMMVTELCDKGNLAQYLRNSDHKWTLVQYRQLCGQIASGMWHISTCGIIHRDLRAENIFLSGETKLIAKVADFGMARSLQSRDTTRDLAYYRMTEAKEIPIAWTAPEVLNQSDQLKYVAASDVWSFGIVMWEIYSRGIKPFDGMAVQLMAACIRDPKRTNSLLDCPTDCPDDVFAVMNSCWAFNYQDRPTFEQLYNQLS